MLAFPDKSVPIALALGCLFLIAALPPSAVGAPAPMAAPTETLMRASLVKAADWMLTVTGPDGQLSPPQGAPAWERESAGRMCLNGLVLLRAYQATGVQAYMDRAKACAALAGKNIQAGKSYVIARTGALPGEAAGGFVDVVQGKIDDAYQAGHSGGVTYDLWQATSGLLFLMSMYRVTGNNTFLNDAGVLDRFIHKQLFLDANDPTLGLVDQTTLSAGGTWTVGKSESTVEHAVLLWAIRLGKEDLAFLWNDRISIFSYLAGMVKADGSYDDRTSYPGQTSSSEVQHAIMVPAMWELGVPQRARELAEWVKGHQVANGSFECPHDMDDYGDTSYAVIGLLPMGEIASAGDGINWLIAQQRPDGAWPNLPDHPPWTSRLYSTEWAAIAVSEGLANYNLQINGTMLSSEAIWEGTPPRVMGFGISATVNDQGLASLRGVLVRAYDGDPKVGGKLMDERTVDVPALGSASTVLAFRPAARGPHDVYVTVTYAPGGEFRTQDNVATIHVNLNRDPTGVITSPKEAELYAFQAVINFAIGDVRDADSDAVTLEWAGNVTGPLSDQPGFARILPPGEHAVTVRLLDGNGPGSSYMVNFSVRGNLAPTVRISTPADGSRYFDYQPVQFDASATSDPEGQELTFTWASDVDGPLGQGPAISRRLTPGPHSITVWADDGWANVSKSVRVTVQRTFPPTVVITLPKEGTEYVVTTRVRFDGTLTNDTDSDFLEYYWTSNIDGLLSERVSFLSYLSVGRHTITLSVNDGNYNISRQVRINVVENHEPTAIISGPENEAKFYSDQTVELNGSASSDAEDLLSYFWVSDREGVMGTDAVVEARLHRGVHHITLFVDDGHGHNVSTSVSVTILNRGPNARISAPREGDTLYTGVEAGFLSEGSTDPEGDRLTFAWEVRSGAGLWVPFSTEKVAQRKFDKAGNYQVRLTVNDGQVQNQTVVGFKVVTKEEQKPQPGFGAALAAGAVLAAVAISAVRAHKRRR
jgi:hypothetical protein